MCNGWGYYKKITSKIYEKLKIQHSIKISNRMKGENHPLFEFGHSEETKQKISISLTGLTHSEETKQKIRENHARLSGENHPMYGKHHTEETKQKMSESRKGEKNPMYNSKRFGEKNPMFGKNHSEETKQKISEKKLGHGHSEETKQKMSKNRKGENNPMYGKSMPCKICPHCGRSITLGNFTR